VRGVVGGAGAGKFHGWLSGMGAVATVGSIGRVAVIADVCVAVGT
jgi:hypothetical protein